MQRVWITTVLIALFIFNSDFISAQVPDCPKEYQEVDWTTALVPAFFTFYPPSAEATINYQSRKLANGEYEVIVDEASLTFLNNDEILFNPDEIYDNREWLVDLFKIEIAKELALWEGTGQVTVSFIKKKECLKFLKCFFQVHHEAEVVCIDDGWDVEDIEWFTDDDGVRYIGHGATVVCGYKCCKTVVVYDCDTDKFVDEYVVEYPGTACDCTESYDCKFGDPNPLFQSCD